MADVVDSIDSSVTERTGRYSDRALAIGVISAHTLEHIYSRSFVVLIPAIYVGLGLAPIQAGLLDAVRQLSGGLTSMVGGIIVDVIAHRRGQILAFSFGLMGVGFFLIAVAPTYPLILAAAVIASAGTSLWHPPALGLLAERFPHKKGLVISLHRSTGSIGDSIGPLIVGALLAVVGWRWIVGGGAPLLLILAAVMFVLLWNVGSYQPASVSIAKNLVTQLRNMNSAMRGTKMWVVFAVSAIRGMGDTSLFWLLPLYLSQELDKSNFIVGVHVALLAAPGVVSGPLFGVLSDRIGRKSIIVFVMAASAILPATMVLGGEGLGMTFSVALFGLFLYSVNSLTQAAAIDIAEGKRLEATFIGLMWGSNAFFGAATSIAAGWLVGRYGWPPAFYMASVLLFLGFLFSLFMPATGMRKLLSSSDVE